MSTIQFGAPINLKNGYKDGGYLDTRGRVMDIPEFKEAAQTEYTFVSTYGTPERDHGSGTWKVISAEGKGADEPIGIGDKVYLDNMYPDVGFLDTWGYVQRGNLPPFKTYPTQLGVFTTTDEARINSGSATWTVVSANGKQDGDQLDEGDAIHLKSEFPNGGFLDTCGRVMDVPEFKGYDGQQLFVFTSTSSDRDHGSGTWTVTSAA